jgi:uncharacterized membrane protein
VPWIGVMTAGYAFGAVMIRESDERDRLCLRIGLSATALFLVLASITMVIRPAQDDGPRGLLRLLDQNKYRDSQLYLLMTLGPTIALLPLAGRAQGWLAGVFGTFGRVPMFYYLLHIPVIHITALLLWLIRDGKVDAERFASAPSVWIPEADRWSLPLLYLAFFISVAALYWPCRWFAGAKSVERKRWMRYL